MNWQSSPQVVELLKSRGHAVTNANEETLQALAADELLAALILTCRDAGKRVSTYGASFISDYVNQHTGRIHPDYYQVGAATGRMSCQRPNLQNIPRDPTYRACFRPADGRVLIKADYSQIELRIAAQISRDRVMQAAFQRGNDLHVVTAARSLGLRRRQSIRQHAS